MKSLCMNAPVAKPELKVYRALTAWMYVVYVTLMQAFCCAFYGRKAFSVSLNITVYTGFPLFFCCCFVLFFLHPAAAYSRPHWSFYRSSPFILMWDRPNNSYISLHWMYAFIKALTYKTFPFTPTGNLVWLSNPICMSLGCGTKMDNPEGTHTGSVCLSQK